MKRTASFIISLIFTLITFAQEGIPYISHFDEITDIEVLNWAICQDRDNVMLFANRRGFLTYDGYNWDLTYLEHIPVSMDKCPADNRIYMGSNNNYGIIEKDREGSYKYLSLSGDTVATGLITNIIFTDTTVIFYSEKSISVHKLDDPSDYKRWYADPGLPFTGMIAHSDKLFFNVKGQGLHRIDCDTLFPIVTGYLTENREILFSIPFDKDRKLVGTDDNRLQLFDRIKYYDYEVSRPDYLKENILSGAVFISDSLLALSTLYGGIMVVDKQTGDEVALLNYQNGLPDDEVYAMKTDNNKGLWLTHGYGICRVDFNLPVSSYSHYPGLEGTITTVLFHNNRILAGTNVGLFYLDQVREYDKKEVLYRRPPSSKAGEPGDAAVDKKAEEEKAEEKPVRSFLNRLFGRETASAEKTDTLKEEGVTEIIPEEPEYDRRTVSVLKSINYVYRKIKRLDNRVKQLLPAGSGVMALSSSGLHYIENNAASLILDDRAINSIYKLNEKEFIVCGNSGVFSLSRDDGTWKAGGLSGGIDGPVYNAIALDESSIWLGTMNKVLRLKGSWTEQDFDIKEYHFPGKYRISYEVAKAGDSLFAFAETGIFTYSLEDDSFIPYNNTGRGIEAGKRYKFLNSGVNCPMIQADDGWKCLNTGLEGTEKTESILRLFDDPGYINIDEGGSVWLIDKKNDIYRIKQYRKESLDTDFSIYISSVRSSGRNFHEFDNMVFEAGEKDIIVSITAPYYLKRTSTRYQYLIEGSMKTWSAWSTSPEINIFRESGNYTIRFRAMNILGETSEEKVIRFSIKPPFTRSTLFYIIISFLVAGLFTLFVIFREKKLKHDKKVLEEKVRERTLELEQKKEQIELQRDEIMQQKEEITSSIAYASRIQTAMLSGRQLFKNSFKDYFIMFKPRDIVSGDFYWIAGNQDSLYFTAADCTGHGVPGAFMSMLGISLLNEITSDGEKDFKPSEILELLRSKVITSLSHTSTVSKAMDGMDLAFCKYDKKKKVLEYAGAFNTLYHFRKGKLAEYKADRMPVGSYIPRAGSFTNNEIRVKPGDVIYIFSDGYTDQFGGPENKKYSTRRFKATLAEIAGLPMKKQEAVLEERFMDWKGENRQLDDVILIGVSF